MTEKLSDLLREIGQSVQVILKKTLTWQYVSKPFGIASKNIEQWNNVLWSDESPFLLRYVGRTRVWRLPNERYKDFRLKGTVKHDIKINV